MRTATLSANEIDLRVLATARRAATAGKALNAGHIARYLDLDLALVVESARRLRRSGHWPAARTQHRRFRLPAAASTYVPDATDWRFLQAYESIREAGQRPTLRRIAAAVGLDLPAARKRHRALADAGLLCEEDRSHVPSPEEIAEIERRIAEIRRDKRDRMPPPIVCDRIVRIHLDGRSA